MTIFFFRFLNFCDQAGKHANNVAIKSAPCSVAQPDKTQRTSLKNTQEMDFVCEPFNVVGGGYLFHLYGP